MSTGNFVLQLGPRRGDRYRLQVEKSPFGNTTTFFRPPGAPRAPAYRDLSTHADPDPHDDLWDRTESDLRSFGTQLYESLFKSEAGPLLQRSRGKCSHLRIHIRIDPKDEELDIIRSLPWELLCEPETERFLCLSNDYSIVRLIEVPYGNPPTASSANLRILAVTSNPNSCQDLNVAREMKDLELLEQRNTGIEVEVLENATLQDLRDTLRRGQHQILHYIGHGSFDPNSGTGWLGFKRSDGTEDQVKGDTLAAKLQGCKALRLVFLNACNSGTGTGSRSFKPFAGLANSLIQSGIPSVLAMQQPIRDRAAIAFSQKFYQNLAAGYSVDAAVSEGRQAIHSESPDRPEWAIPCLFTRSTEGQIVEDLQSDRPETPTRIKKKKKAKAPPKANIFIGSLLSLSLALQPTTQHLTPKKEIEIINLRITSEGENLQNQETNLTFLDKDQNFHITTKTDTKGMIQIPIRRNRLPLTTLINTRNHRSKTITLKKNTSLKPPTTITLEKTQKTQPTGEP